jgi:hypothetical protein
VSMEETMNLQRMLGRLPCTRATQRSAQKGSLEALTQSAGGCSSAVISDHTICIQSSTTKTFGDTRSIES